MSLKIKEEVINAENLVGANTAQTVLQGTLALPGSAPSISRIVWIRGSAVVVNSVVAEDRVILEGHINLQMVYMADDMMEERFEYQKLEFQQAVTLKNQLQKTLEVSAGFEPVDMLLDIELTPVEVETQVTKETINLTGKLEPALIYLDSTANVRKYTVADMIPFQMSLPNDSGLNELDVTPKIQVSVHADVPEKPGTLINIDVEISAYVEICELRYANVLSELTCSGNCIVETRKETLRVDNLVNQKSQQVSAQGVIELSDQYPPIREIIKAWGSMRVTDYRLDEDKVYVDGTVSIELAYLAHTDDEQKPLYYVDFRNAIVFQQVVAIGGVQPGMLAKINLATKEIRLDLINRETVEADVIYQLQMAITQPIEEEVVVEAMEVPAVEEDPPTLTYVRVQNTDTIWKLAKKYHTSLDAIVAANSWLRERDDVQVAAGDKICIPRR